MRRVFTVLTAGFVAFSFSSMVFAQGAAEKKPAETKAVAKAEKATTLSASGKVAKIDETTRALTVTTKAGDKEFALAADAKIMAGVKEAKVADLTGKKVKVTYSVVDGKNVASKVTVAASKKAPSAAKAPEKPAEKK